MILQATQPPFFRHPIQWVTETTTTTGSLKSNFFCLEKCAPRVFGVHPIRNLGFNFVKRFGWCIFHKRCKLQPLRAAEKKILPETHIFLASENGKSWYTVRPSFLGAFLDGLPFQGRKMLFVSGVKVWNPFPLGGFTTRWTEKPTTMASPISDSAEWLQADSFCAQRRFRGKVLESAKTWGNTKQVIQVVTSLSPNWRSHKRLVHYPKTVTKNCHKELPGMCNFLSCLGCTLVRKNCD